MHLCANGCGTLLSDLPAASECCGDALGHREEQRDDAERLLAMLRVTAQNREKHSRDEADAADADGCHVEGDYWSGAADAWAIVLSLLGPEQPETYNPNEPF